jgi:DNA translocase FtsK/SpoIIIE-like protein
MNRALTYVLVLLGLLGVLAATAVLVAGWHAFEAISSTPVKILVVLVVLIALPLLGRWIKRAYLSWLEVQHAKEELTARQDERRRINERHEVDLYLAKTRLPADAQGNRAFIYEELTGRVIEVPSGNFVQSVPHTYAPHLAYIYKDTSTRIQEEEHTQALLPPGPVQHPSMDYVRSLLQENALQVCLEMSATSGQPCVMHLLDGTHYRIIGGSGFGKSCEAAAILEMTTQTNDPAHLQIALLDLEHKTSRLFENLPHIAELSLGRKRVPLVATSPDEVALHLHYLRRELDRRTQLSEYDLSRERFLFIYVEEFLSLKREVDPALKRRMLDDFSILALRGRKYGLYLLACAQVDYADDQLREAMNQFNVNMSFAVRPRAAQAAGFASYDLLKQNFEAKKPGQFVLETTGCTDLMLAPQFDVKAKLQELERRAARLSSHSAPVLTPFSSPDLRLIEAARTPLERTENTDEGTDERPWQADMDEVAVKVMKLRTLGWGKQAIIEKIWSVTKGGSKRYKEAEALYERILETSSNENYHEESEA